MTADVSPVLITRSSADSKNCKIWHHNWHVTNITAGECMREESMVAAPMAKTSFVMLTIMQCVLQYWKTNSCTEIWLLSVISPQWAVSAQGKNRRSFTPCSALHLSRTHSALACLYLVNTASVLAWPRLQSLDKVQQRPDNNDEHCFDNNVLLNMLQVYHFCCLIVNSPLPLPWYPCLVSDLPAAQILLLLPWRLLLTTSLVTVMY